MTRVEIIITEWTWVVSLYYIIKSSVIISRGTYCIYFSEDQSV